MKLVVKLAGRAVWLVRCASKPWGMTSNISFGAIYTFMESLASGGSANLSSVISWPGRNVLETSE